MTSVDRLAPGGFGKTAALITCLLVGVLLLPLLSQPAMARPPFSAITVDASTGKIIYSSNIDSKRYPASLTKVMTLYLMFQEIEAGRMSFSTPMKVSSHAARQQPSKLGLRVGSTITARNAMLALITKSANDAAMVIAEHIGGSQKGFAKRMTRQARAMGMTRTTFTNPNGLPDRRQVTTARDMATLGLRIQRDFPQYYKNFATRTFKFRDRNYRNHNRLLGRVKGVDGIKTGYIRASGFNLLSSRVVGDRRIVAVVIGGRTGKSRNAFMTKILKRDLKKASRGGNKIAMVAGNPPGYKAPSGKTNNKKAKNPTRSKAPVPRDKPAFNSRDSEKLAQLASAYQHTVPTADVPVSSAAVAEQSRDAGRTTDVLPTSGVTFTSVVVQPPSNKADRLTLSDPVGFLAASIPQSKDQSRIHSTSIDQAAGPAGTGQVATRSGATEAQPETGSSVIDNASHNATWNIQIGAFPTRQGARKRLETAKTRKVAELQTATPFLMAVDRNGSTLYRARFSGLNRGQARRACRQLKRAGVGCFPLAPTS